MHIDIDAKFELNAVRRQVELVSREDNPGATVSLSRRLAKPVSNIWRKITDPDQLSHWFLPISGQLEPGGHYSLKGNASGTILSCVPNSSIALTWEFAGNMSWMDLAFVATSEENTDLTIAHTSLFSPHWDQYGAGATGVGWEMALMGFSHYILDPSYAEFDEEAFITSDTGIEFIEGSCKGWAAASIDGGIDSEIAHAAARQTSAFYRGVPLD